MEISQPITQSDNEQEQQPVKKSFWQINRFILKNIWLNPRKTIKEVCAQRPSGMLLFYLSLSLFVEIVLRMSHDSLLHRFSATEITIFLLVLVLITPILAYIFINIGAFFLLLPCALFKGKTKKKITMRELYTICASTRILQLYGTLGGMVLGFLSGIFLLFICVTTGLSIKIALGAGFIIAGLSTMVSGFWAIVSSMFMLSELQQCKLWRAIVIMLFYPMIAGFILLLVILLTH